MFYEVGKEGLHRYADFGLTFVKLGEEARVDLAVLLARGGAGQQAPSGAASGSRRRAATFRIVPAAEVPAVMDQLRAVSDDWLREKAGGEKGFSLGFFDPGYVAALPGGGRRARGAHRGLRQPVAGAGQGRAVGRPHALPPGRAEGRHGSALRPPPALGQGAGLPLVRARDGAALRLRDARRSRRCGRGSAASSTSTARRSTTSRACARTRRSSTRSGSRATSPIPAGWRCRESWPTSRP